MCKLMQLVALVARVTRRHSGRIEGVGREDRLLLAAPWNELLLPMITIQLRRYDEWQQSNMYGILHSYDVIPPAGKRENIEDQGWFRALPAAPPTIHTATQYGILRKRLNHSLHCCVVVGNVLQGVLIALRLGRISCKNRSYTTIR